MKKKIIKRPLITVITVIFNNPEALEKTIISVINQSFRDFEFIIIDGGSDKPTLDVIKKYKNNIDYWVSKKDKGIFDAMNKGINLARGHWINFMNADDTYVDDEVLNKMHKFLDKRYATVYGNTLINKKVIRPYPINKFTLSVTSPTCHQSTFFQTNILRKYKFDLVNNVGGDPEQLVRLYSDNYKFRYVDVTVANYVLGGVSSKYIVKGVKNKIKYIYRHFGAFWTIFTIIFGIKRIILSWMSRLIKK